MPDDSVFVDDARSFHGPVARHVIRPPTRRSDLSGLFRPQRRDFAHRYRAVASSDRNKALTSRWLLAVNYPEQWFLALGRGTPGLGLVAPWNPSKEPLIWSLNSLACLLAPGRGSRAGPLCVHVCVCLTPLRSLTDGKRLPYFTVH